MTRSQRLKVMRQAIGRCELLARQWPGHQTVCSIIGQLRYLATLNEGAPHDGQQVDQVTIGLLALRTLEGVAEDDLVEQLYLIDCEARAMRREIKGGHSPGPRIRSLVGRSGAGLLRLTAVG